MTSPRYYRKVIHIAAEDSPNVRLALAQKARGLPVTHETLVPGVLSYREYLKRMRLWDAIRRCISLSGRFWKGKEALLYPPAWLDHSHRCALELLGRARLAKAIGIDPAEGGDSTTMAAVDEWGLIDLVSKKTPNTAVIKREVIEFGAYHRVPPENWLFDRGGGGKQHADYLREIELADGTRPYEGVRTVGFGETPALMPKRGLHMLSTRLDMLEERYVYTTRRAQMYGDLAVLLEPDADGWSWAIPDHDPVFLELRRQMAPIPKIYDKEGRLKMLPKRKKPGTPERCLEDLLGCSPDELDSVVLAVHGLLHPMVPVEAGCF